GRAGRLHDVVLKDRAAPEGAQDADGEDRDRDGRGDGQSGAQPYVDRDRAEEQAKDGTEEHGADGELAAAVTIGYVGLENGLRGSELFDLGHAQVSGWDKDETCKTNTWKGLAAR